MGDSNEPCLANLFLPCVDFLLDWLLSQRGRPGFPGSTTGPSTSSRQLPTSISASYCEINVGMMTLIITLYEHASSCLAVRLASNFTVSNMTTATQVCFRCQVAQLYGFFIHYFRHFLKSFWIVCMYVCMQNMYSTRMLCLRRPAELGLQAVAGHPTWMQGFRINNNISWLWNSLSSPQPFIC